MSEPAAGSSSPLPPPSSPPAASDPAAPAPQATAQPIDYTPPALAQRVSLLRAGGALGVAAVIVVVLLFVLACFRLRAAFHGFPIIGLVASIAGIILTLIGGVRRAEGDEDTHILFGLFVNGFALAAALLEIGIYKNWNLF